MSIVSKASRNLLRLRHAAQAVLLTGAALSVAGCVANDAHPSFALAPAMGDGGVVMPPEGWLEFCGRHEDDVSCRAPVLTAVRARQLHAVQAAIRHLPAVSDEARFHEVDYWEAADRKGGDCEDFAIAARARLLQLGWPRPALRLATTWTEQNEFHLVLTVDVSVAGRVSTVVLDHRFPQVESWQRLRGLGYRFEARQSAVGATWVRIVNPAEPVGPAVRLASNVPAFAAHQPGLTARIVPVFASVERAPYAMAFTEFSDVPAQFGSWSLRTRG